MNSVLGLFLVVFLGIASLGAMLAINDWIGAYMNTESWLITIGSMGFFDVFILLKADRGLNPK